MTDTRPYRPSKSDKKAGKPGFSIRQHLYNQGVTTKEGIDAHLSFILSTLKSNPNLNLRSYKVNPNNPNVPLMG